MHSLLPALKAILMTTARSCGHPYAPTSHNFYSTLWANMEIQSPSAQAHTSLSMTEPDNPACTDPCLWKMTTGHLVS
jgi:hypothetical protein